MSDIRDLLHTAAARPDGPLDTDRVLASARRRTRRRHAGAVLAIVSVVLLVVSVISVLPPREQAVTLADPTTPAPSVAATASSVVSLADIEGRWDLVSGVSDGQPLVVQTDGRPHHITFIADDRDPSAEAWWGCNSHGYRLVVDEGGVSVTGAGHTEEGCGPGNAIEATLDAAFQVTADAALQDGALVLTGPGTTLRFVRGTDTAPEEQVAATTADGRFEQVVANGVIIWRHAAPPDADAPAPRAIVSGRVGYDPECGFHLDDGAGQRLGVVWPAGTTAGVTADAMNPSVELPGGLVVAVDHQVSGGGGYRPPDALVEVGCVPDGEEVAVFNASGPVTVIGTSPPGVAQPSTTDTMVPPPAATVPSTATTSGADGTTLTAEALPGHMIADGALGFVVRPVSGALAIPPAGVAVHRWDGQAWQPTASQPFAGTGDAVLTTGRPFPGTVWPEGGAEETFPPGWYELEVAVVEQGTAEPRPTLPVGSRVVVPQPDADLRPLADVLPTQVTATDGNQAIRMEIADGTVTVTSTGTDPVTLPDVSVHRYQQQWWVGGPVIPQGTSLQPGQAVSVDLDPLLEDADALRIQIGALEPLHAALEYVGTNR